MSYSGGKKTEGAGSDGAGATAKDDSGLTFPVTIFEAGGTGGCRVFMALIQEARLTRDNFNKTDLFKLCELIKKFSEFDRYKELVGEYLDYLSGTKEQDQDDFLGDRSKIIKVVGVFLLCGVKVLEKTASTKPLADAIIALNEPSKKKVFTQEMYNAISEYPLLESIFMERVDKQKTFNTAVLEHDNLTSFKDATGRYILGFLNCIEGYHRFVSLHDVRSLTNENNVDFVKRALRDYIKFVAWQKSQGKPSPLGFCCKEEGEDQGVISDGVREIATHIVNHPMNTVIRRLRRHLGIQYTAPIELAFYKLFLFSGMRMEMVYNSQGEDLYVVIRCDREFNKQLKVLKAALLVAIQALRGQSAPKMAVPIQSHGAGVGAGAGAEAPSEPRH